MAGYNPRARERGDEMTRSRIVPAFAGRRREMQHCERRRAQARKRSSIVEVAYQRNDAVSAKLPDVVRSARESHEADAMPKALCHAQRDIAASYEQDSMHRATGAGSAPQRWQAIASRDPAQEPSMLMPTQPQ